MAQAVSLYTANVGGELWECPLPKMWHNNSWPFMNPMLYQYGSILESFLLKKVIVDPFVQFMQITK